MQDLRFGRLQSSFAKQSDHILWGDVWLRGESVEHHHGLSDDDLRVEVFQTGISGLLGAGCGQRYKSCERKLQRED
jgi:hypothetical protein